jgi:hypothetical protein
LLFWHLRLCFSRPLRLPTIFRYNDASLNATTIIQTAGFRLPANKAQTHRVKRAVTRHATAWTKWAIPISSIKDLPPRKRFGAKQKRNIGSSTSGSANIDFASTLYEKFRKMRGWGKVLPFASQYMTQSLLP